MTQLNLCLSICEKLDVTNLDQISIAQISESSKKRSKFRKKSELQCYSQFFISSVYDIIVLSRNESEKQQMSVNVLENEYAVDGGKRVNLVEYSGPTRTIEVEVTEVLKRVIEVQIPDKDSDDLALEVVSDLYDRQDFYLDGDDLDGSAKIELV